MDRRGFLRGAIEAVGVAWLAARLPRPARAAGGPVPRRALGRTGVEVSAVGLGGFHVGQMADAEAGVRLIRDAVDRGITFLDNCWDYNGGQSERRMGRALRDGWRDKVFLMTKVDGRSKANAARQIDESLARLETDHLDLLQLHEVIRLEDPDRAFAEGGAMEALADARRAGKARFLGFTGHKDPQVHLRMLDAAAAHGFRFDAVQMPLNLMDAHFRSFEQHVLPRLVADGIGVLGMKSMGGKVLLESGIVTPLECLRYALALPTATVITGIDAPAILDQAVEAATAPPLAESEVRALRAKTATAAATGRWELFKTADRFDGTARHPEWIA